MISIPGCLLYCISDMLHSCIPSLHNWWKSLVRPRTLILILFLLDSWISEEKYINLTRPNIHLEQNKIVMSWKIWVYFSHAKHNLLYQFCGWSDELAHLGMGRDLGFFFMFSRVALGFRVQTYEHGWANQNLVVVVQEGNTIVINRAVLNMVHSVQ